MFKIRKSSTMSPSGDSSRSFTMSSAREQEESSNSFTQQDNKQTQQIKASNAPFSYKKKKCLLRFASLSVNKLNFSSSGLQGRHDETKQLFDALHRLVDETNVHPEIVLVGGAIGTGKSRLADQLKKSPAHISTRSIYTLGKFHRHQTNAYSAIGSACSDLCERILKRIENESKEQALYKRIQENLKNSLGSEAHTLVPLIPSLGDLLGRDFSNVRENVSEYVNFLECKNQFHLALRRLLRAIGSVLPVCLVLEDVQWADQASLDVVETLLTDRDNQGLLFVATYRSGAVNKSHRVMKMISNVMEARQNPDMVITGIILKNLGILDVNKMVEDLLSADNSAATIALAKVVQRKTAGNPLFIEMFLQSLVREELLVYNFGLLKWTWNIEEVEAQTRVSESVVDERTAEIEYMSDEVRRGLLLAACLGSTFSKDVLALLMVSLMNDEVFLSLVNHRAHKRSSSLRITASIAVDDWLASCANEGLIEACGVDTASFRWVNDRVRESTLRLASSSQLDSIKFKVGQVLVQSWDSSLLEQSLFVAANYLNEKGDEFSVEIIKHLRVSELNLRAGRKAISSSSFDTAGEYFRNGIGFLPADCWESQYELTLQLHTLAAKAEYTCGDFDRMQACCDVILAKARNLPDKFPIYPMLIDAVGTNIGAQKAVDTAIDMLAQLGCHFPKRGRLFHTVVGLARLKMATAKVGPEEISTLGVMTDENKLEAMQVLERLSGWAMLAKSDILPLATFKSYHWTLQYGLSQNAPNAMVSVGLVMGMGLGDQQVGRRYALEALKLSQKTCQTKSNRARTLITSYGLLLPRTQSIGSCMPPLLDAYKMSLEHGDVSVAMWSIYMYLDLLIGEGRKLEEIDAGFREYVWKMNEANQMKPYNFSRLSWQGILNLMGQSEDPLMLTGEAMNESSFIKEFDQTRDEEMIANVNFQHVFLSCLYGNHKQAAEISMSVGDQFPEHFPAVTRYRFLSALSCASMARTTKKRKYKRHARHLSHIIKSWVKEKNPNVIHHDLLVDAELAALEGKNILARKKFEAAIRYSARSGFIHDQALANERFGEFLFYCLNDQLEAAYRLEDSIRLYDEWGAVSKAGHLRKALADMLLTSRTTDRLKVGDTQSMLSYSASIDDADSQSPSILSNEFASRSFSVLLKGGTCKLVE